MAVQVFISHSVAPWELAFVNGVADVAAQRGAIPTLPDRAWDAPVDPLPARIAAQIQSADYMIVMATHSGQHLDWVNQEVTASQELSPSKPLLIVADVGLPVASGQPCIRIDRTNPLATLQEVSSRVQHLIHEQSSQALLRGMLLAGLALLFLKGK